MRIERLYEVVRAPHISEKSTLAAEERNEVVFKVAVDARKAEIRQAVEQLFDVKVRDVRTVKMKGKRKRFGRLEGKRPDWKKAYVTLEEGNEIDFLGGAE
ncbi:50S ribosomal protein L23 [Alkalilimnicola ehrlichii MLHE-1]|uniref:Large ribosomal subunit protein uL23 n=1 Tax=Alkalilimnicola ehrlichii (strain ATCC BAA-1101 / DSM 17681 / MLHE-1) TaxID=187272 RepID=RL23_ALKEH|nr:50S ribosomal protein L23 [Alkalilimnicola ehrlichii]Q0ABH3.1 RecName: Full=Large ribosomal subunit protein uL23; AltName: Full=50S ribosomal protein L23 [Alkalilimnicola ehrlichii MLHE-1]ABI55814.1 LSU ribosomal protein L23P [Alkalilimnicola ehrlichii MLHE-1]